MTQAAGDDAVVAHGFDVLQSRPLPSLWHLALFAAEVLPHGGEAVRVVNAPRERDGDEPARPLGCAIGCATLPMLLALSAWLGNGEVGAALAWTVTAVAAGAVGWGLCLGTNSRDKETAEARRLAATWPVERARNVVLAATETPAPGHPEFAPCVLNCDLPLPPGVHELLARQALVWGRQSEGWRLDRAELRPSDVLPGHVRIGRSDEFGEIAARPDTGEVLVALGSAADAEITERYPSVWQFLLGRLFDTPAALAQLECTDSEGPRVPPANDPPPSLDATRDP